MLNYQRVKLNSALFPWTCGPSQGHQWQHPQASSKSASSSYSRCARMPQRPCYDHILPDREWILGEDAYFSTRAATKYPKNTQKRPGWGMTPAGLSERISLGPPTMDVDDIQNSGATAGIVTTRLRRWFTCQQPKIHNYRQVKPLAQFQDMCIILQKRSTPSVNSETWAMDGNPLIRMFPGIRRVLFSQRLPKISKSVIQKSSTKNKTSKHQHDTLDNMVIHGPLDPPSGASSSPVLPWDCPSAAPFPTRWPGAWGLCDSRRASSRIGWWRMVWGGIDDINLARLVEILMINGLGSSPVFWVGKHGKTV